MKMMESIPAAMIAPCGINCAACYAHLRARKRCLGCQGADAAKPAHCLTCKIRACAVEKGLEFCHQCAGYPCKAIRYIDKRYRLSYQHSLIETSLHLKAIGPDAYMAEEREKWACKDCGGVISLHDQACSECGKKP